MEYVGDQQTLVVQDLHMDIVQDHVEDHRYGRALVLEEEVIRVVVLQMQRVSIAIHDVVSTTIKSPELSGYMEFHNLLSMKAIHTMKVHITYVVTGALYVKQ
jgi:hypothetical protein